MTSKASAGSQEAVVIDVQVDVDAVFAFGAEQTFGKLI